MSSFSASAHAKSIAVIEAVAREKYGLTARAIAQRTGLGLSSTRFHLRALVELGVLERDELPNEPRRDQLGHFKTNGQTPDTWRLSIVWLLRLSTPHLLALDMARQAREELSKA